MSKTTTKEHKKIMQCGYEFWSCNQRSVFRPKLDVSHPACLLPEPLSTREALMSTERLTYVDCILGLCPQVPVGINEWEAPSGD